MIIDVLAVGWTYSGYKLKSFISRSNQNILLRFAGRCWDFTDLVTTGFEKVSMLAPYNADDLVRQTALTPGCKVFTWFVRNVLDSMWELGEWLMSQHESLSNTIKLWLMTGYLCYL